MMIKGVSIPRPKSSQTAPEIEKTCLPAHASVPADGTVATVGAASPAQPQGDGLDSDVKLCCEQLMPPTLDCCSDTCRVLLHVSRDTLPHILAMHAYHAVPCSTVQCNDGPAGMCMRRCMRACVCVCTCVRACARARACACVYVEVSLGELGANISPRLAQHYMRL